MTPSKALEKRCHGAIGAIAKRPDAQQRLTLLLSILQVAQKPDAVKCLSDILTQLHSHTVED